MEQIKQKIMALPTSSGVYLMKDKDANVIYVGKAKNLKNRVKQYFTRGQKDLKVQNMVSNVADVDFFVVHNEYDALALENNLIKKYMPYYNILLKDSKNFAYIKLVKKDDFPHFEITRRLDKKNRFFGPYFAGLKASDILEVLNYAYPIRKCNLKITENSKSRRHCIFYDIHLCSAPCEHKISKEDYAKIVDDAIRFLQGDTKKIEKILTEKMNLASGAQNYETALNIRNQLAMLKKFNDKTVAQLTHNVDYDIFALATLGTFSAICAMFVRGGKLIGVQTYQLTAFLEQQEAFTQFLISHYMTHPLICDEIIVPDDFNPEDILLFLKGRFQKNVTITKAQRGIKNKLLKMCFNNARLDLEKNIEKNTKQQNETTGAIIQLKNDLNLSKIPKRIECYDISTLFGKDTVASMSVLINGSKAIKHYRKFKIRTVDFIDDFASMKEVLGRRFSKLNEDDISFSSMPDLIIIDGGKGQLSSAVEVVRQFNYPNDIISLAKKQEEIFVPGNSQPILLKKGTYSLRIVQLARDEAHRFAITYNKSLRQKSSFSGGLMAIDGVGNVVRRLLLSEFRTIENIKNATLEQLHQIKGLNKTTAQNIFNHFNK